MIFLRYKIIFQILAEGGSKNRESTTLLRIKSYDRNQREWLLKFLWLQKEHNKTARTEPERLISKVHDVPKNEGLFEIL